MKTIWEVFFGTAYDQLFLMEVFFPSLTTDLKKKFSSLPEISTTASAQGTLQLPADQLV